MNAPHRFRTLHDIRRPWLAWSDPRVALGAVTPKPHWPKTHCVHCVVLSRGAWIQATGYDTAGNPCCEVCAANPNRRAA